MTPIQILTTSRGNDFMVEVARLVECSCRRDGMAVELLIDRLPEVADGGLPLIVAPHEYVPLFLDRTLGMKNIGVFLNRCAVLNVEQPGSQWFEIACRHAADARAIFDISLAGVLEFRRRGIPASHLPLEAASFLAAPHLPPVAERPIDVLFLGYASPRREGFFARQADSLGRLNTRLVFADHSEPRLDSTPGYYAGERRAALLSSAKVVLNVHASDVPYFETHRAHLALANGCVFVSESSTFVDPFVPGEHFVMAGLEALVDAARDCLSRPDRLTAISDAGATFARSQAVRASGAYARALSSVAPVRSSRTADDAAGRRDVVGRLGEAKALRGRGSADWTESGNAGVERRSSPSVSVIVTVYNYARFLADCLTSVRASEPVPGGFEIVVVDDGSTDDSPAVAAQHAAESDVPIRVVVKSSNTGLADARNLGLRVSRGRYAFILDADNRLFPACLRTLHASITASGSAAAYGLIQRFDQETGIPIGLLSMLDWNPRALVRGPYIDAMALLDREVVLRVGGYSDDLVEHGWFGWEDYDLWLRFCEANASVDFVPQILSAYRVHPHSMIQQTNRWSRDVARHFATTFRGLIARFPGEDRYFGFPAADLGLGGAAPAPLDAPDGLLREHVRNLERELAAVYASKSWRLTAPLRFGLGVLRGERRRR